MSIRVNLDPLETTSDLPYLSRRVNINNSDLVALYKNTRKVHRWRGMEANVLTKTGETVQAWAMMYKAMVQTAILYGSENWVVRYAMLEEIGEFPQSCGSEDSRDVISKIPVWE